jgi:hypothetical protein
MENSDTTSNQDEQNKVEMHIMGWASIAIDEVVPVDPIHDENGDLDREATLRQIDEQKQKEALISALLQRDPAQLMEKLIEDVETDHSEIKETAE